MSIQSYTIDGNGGGASDVNSAVCHLYEDSFHINSDLLDSETLKPMVHRLASLDIYNKYNQNAANIQSLHVVVGTEITVQYSFLAGPEIQELNQQYKKETPKISLPTDVFTNEIMESEKASHKFLDLSKLSMTLRDPKTGKVYFRTHTGKVYDNHFAFGEVPLVAKGTGRIVNINCDHVFKSVEQQTRSGDEEITVTKICIKCNADHKNLKKLPSIVPDEYIDKVAQRIYQIVEGDFDYEEAHTIARVMASLD